MDYRHSNGNRRRQSNPWVEDTLEKEIKRLKLEKKNIEEEAKNIMKKAEKIKERIKKGTSSKSRLDKMTKHIPEMMRRHHNIDIRIKNLEWDFSNIEKVVDKKCKYCDCKKINIIKLPNNHPHFAKEECSSCGRGQKFIPYPTYTV